MATAAMAQGAMSDIDLCQAVYWAKGVPAETKLRGIGRILGFEQVTAEPEVETASPIATRPPAAQRNKRTRNKANAGADNTTTRVRSGSKREALLNLIRESNGLTRGQILESMGIKGDKSGEMSVSNALTALTKRNEVRREGGKYLPLATGQQGAYTPPQTAQQAAAVGA